MDHIGKFKPTLFEKAPKKTERGELLKEFAGKLGKPIGYVAMRLSGFKLPDLYYIKSIADAEERRGGIWSKVFYGSIKNKPKE